MQDNMVDEEKEHRLNVGAKDIGDPVVGQGALDGYEEDQKPGPRGVPMSLI